MKFLCYQNDLSDALDILCCAADVKSVTPILNGVYLKADDSVLELQANNYKTGIVAKIPAKVYEPGNIVVSGKRFRDFVRGLNDKMVECRLDGNEILIDATDSKVRLLTMDPNDFPTVNMFDNENKFTIRSDRLHDLLKRTIFAAAKDDSRPVFAGVNFTITDNRLTLAATNAHRIAVANTNFISAIHDCQFIVPKDSVATLLAHIPNKDDSSVEIIVADKFIGFMFNNVFVTSRVIDGQFPPYDHVIPKSTAGYFTADVKDFLGAINFAKPMSKETEFDSVRLMIDNRSVEVAASVDGVGNVSKKIDAVVEGDDLNIAFNINYLIDVLKVINSPRVQVAFNDQFSPCVITELGGSDFICVVTPVRTA